MQKRNDSGEAAAEFYDNRRKWAERVSENHDVSHAAFRIGYWLAMRMNGDDQCCWYSVGEIAKRIGCSTKTVTEATANLERLGFMIVIRRPGKGSTYHLRFWWAA